MTTAAAGRAYFFRMRMVGLPNVYWPWAWCVWICDKVSVAEAWSQQKDDLVRGANRRDGGDGLLTGIRFLAAQHVRESSEGLSGGGTHPSQGVCGTPPQLLRMVFANEVE